MQFSDALTAGLGRADDIAPRAEELLPERHPVALCVGSGLERDVGEDALDGVGCEARTFSEITALVLSPFAEKLAYPVDAEAVELVDGPQNREALAGLVLAREADSLHDAVEHLPVVDLDDVLAGQAELFQRIGHQHADLGIRRDGARADDVGIALHELAETAGTGLLVAEDVAGAEAAVGLGDCVEMFGHVPGQRRGEVVAQGQPGFVVVLEREHALVGAVEIGQELAEGLGVFDEGRLQRLEPVELEALADRLQHPVLGGDLIGATVDEAARQARLQRVGLRGIGLLGFGLGHGVFALRSGCRCQAGSIAGAPERQACRAKGVTPGAVVRA